MKRSVVKMIISVMILLIIVSIIFRLVSSKSNSRQKQAAASVIVAKVSLRVAPLLMTTQGIVEASQSVTIQPQVTGVIKKIGFTAGQAVQSGQILFLIDPATYQASLAKAQANLAEDQAQLYATKKDQERYQSLIKKGYVSKQQYDQNQAKLETATGTVQADEALIKQSQIELDYTTITAPIAGKTGNVTVKEGDLVSATNSQTLVTINQLNPIYVDFYLPQKYLSLLMQYQKTQPLTVKVYTENQNQLLDTGVLTFIDNTLNTNTGTLLVKATMPNQNQLLWPGEAVNVSLIFTVEKNILAVPSQAVQTDQNGEFVYLVKNNVALITRIKVLRQVGQWTFVSQGLSEDDTIATVFPPSLQDKSSVVIVPPVTQQVQP